VAPFHTAALSPDGPEPTASQKLAETHETPVTGENPVTAGPADQDDPFQIATCPKPLASKQKLVVTHETDIGCTDVPGIAWSCHEVPFHISASAPPAPTPTAAQKPAVTHEIPKRLPLGGTNGLVGLGTVWICHDVPFHISARLTWLPALSKCVPTASQNLVETHDTEASVS
jgi:hypothetical protein